MGEWGDDKKRGRCACASRCTLMHCGRASIRTPTGCRRVSEVFTREVSMKKSTMGQNASVPGLFLLTPLVPVTGQVLADTRPGKHTHDEKAPQGQTMEGHTHQHDSWEPPPPEYAGARSTRWNDPAAARRGEPLFQTHCMVCHGTDG